jgi:hypothetical protein
VDSQGVLFALTSYGLMDTSVMSEVAVQGMKENFVHVFCNAAGVSEQQQEVASRWDIPVPDAAVLLDSGVTSSPSSSRPGTPAAHGDTVPTTTTTSSSSRPTSPLRLKGAHGNRDGSTTFSFEEESAVGDPEAAAAAAMVKGLVAGDRWVAKGAQ